MANLVVDYAKGRFIQLSTLPLGTDALGIILLQSASLPSDTTIQRNQYLSGILSTGTGSGLEATFTNYSRIWLTSGSITVTVNTSTDIASVALNSNPVWNAAGGATNNSLAALLVTYRPTSSALDNAIQVISKHDFVATTTGGNLTATMSTVATAS